MADQAGADAPARSGSADPIPVLYGGTGTRRITVRDLAAAKAAGQRWPMLTAYDALTAGVFDEAGIPVLLVGDSASMVVYGYDSTLPVEVDDLLPLVAAVVRGTRRAMVVADLPFGSYQGSPQQALETASRFMKAGAHAVKLEGGSRTVPQVETLVSAGVPVMAHLGLTPQSVNVFGGYRVQGRGEAGDQLLHDAKALQHAGAFAIVLEVVPEDLATRVTQQLDIPTVGIGAGAGTDAQVLVWQDLAGLTEGPGAKFVRRYADLRSVLTSAVREWAGDVVSGAYPDEEHTYH
jgi:3-methyl-2-oxobutanoate hydroxymethyltransferase